MSLQSGVVFGLVTNVEDPEGQGRVKVNFPWLGEKHETDWIRISTMMAGNGAGSFFMPDVKDEVLVAHQFNDPNFPVVVGFVWNGKDKIPTGHVRDRMLKSKNGHSLRFIDSTPSGGSKGAVVMEDAHRNRITMSNGKIVIQSTCFLELMGQEISLIVKGIRRNVSATGGPL